MVVSSLLSTTTWVTGGPFLQECTPTTTPHPPRSTTRWYVCCQCQRAELGGSQPGGSQPYAPRCPRPHGTGCRVCCGAQLTLPRMGEKETAAPRGLEMGCNGASWDHGAWTDASGPSWPSFMESPWPYAGFEDALKHLCAPLCSAMPILSLLPWGWGEAGVLPAPLLSLYLTFGLLLLVPEWCFFSSIVELDLQVHIVQHSPETSWQKQPLQEGEAKIFISCPCCHPSSPTRDVGTVNKAPA